MTVINLQSFYCAIQHTNTQNTLFLFVFQQILQKKIIKNIGETDVKGEWHADAQNKCLADYVVLYTKENVEYLLNLSCFLP